LVDPKTFVEMQGNKNSHNNFGKELHGRIHIAQFQNLLQSYGDQDCESGTRINIRPTEL
jgi:hypothetical protein